MQVQPLEGFRLSPQQKHLWLLQQGNNNQPYRVQCAIQIDGELNLKILKVALENVVNQHEILRTTFHNLPGMRIPIQVINDSHIPSIQEHNLIGLAPEKQKTKVDQIFLEALQLPFDFEQSLLHLSLIALSPSQHLLLVSLPAICADTATLNNLLCEISFSYTACLQNEEVFNEPMQYADISEWQNELIESEEGEIGRNYWQKQDISFITAKLPFANQVDETEFSPKFLSLTIEPDLVADIEALIEKYETTYSDFFLACWQILLWRLTGQSEMIVGTAYNGRKYEELESALGLLEKYLPVRCCLQNKLQFQDILTQINASTTEVYKWQEYFTWEQVAAANKNGQGLSFLPFQFSFEKESRKYHVGKLLFSIYQQYTCIERFNIKLSCIQSQDSLRTDFYYNVDLCSVENVKRLMSQFQTLLRSLVNNSAAAIAELNILNHTERQQLLVDFNNTKADYQKHKCIHQLFEEQVERQPDNIAVVFGNQQLTYAELNAQANQLAHHLQQLGVGPGVLVAVYLNRSLEMIPALLGILKAGGAYVPIETSLPKARIQWLLSSLKIKSLIAQSSQLQLIEDLQPELTDLKHLICLDTSQEVTEQPSGDWYIWTRSYLDCLPKENLPKQASSEDIAYVIFTSGSTGTPKGVVVQHKPVINLIEWVNKTFNINASDRVLFVTSLSFDLSVYDIFGLLAAGGSIRVASNSDVRDPSVLLNILYNEPITFWDSAPAALQQLVPFFPSQESMTSKSQLRLVFLSGDWVPLTLPDLLKTSFPGVETIALGGATEATVWSNYYQITEVKPHWNSIPYGKPIQNAQYYILDSYLNPCPVGVPGDLYIGGEVLSSGYINEPTLTAEKFVPNPFNSDPKARLYKTGDLARHLSDGNIEFLGRIDHQVKIRGFRVELGEIEAALAEHQAVRETVVLAREDQFGNKSLVAFLIVNQSAPATNELRHFLQQKLPEYMVPATFVFLNTLPLTPNGKVDRRALLAAAASRTVEVGAIAPRDALELQLVQMWEELLDIRPIGVSDNFFELGGHSLLAVRLMAQIQQQFKQDLPLSVLFQGATIEQLANTLHQQSSSLPWSSVVGIQTAGSKPPFFCVHPVGGNVLCYTDLAKHLGQEQPFYGLQAPGLDGEQEPFTCIEEMAAYYIEQLRVIQPQGPYFLGGWSFGGVVAFEMAQQLHSSGHQVAHVALIDSWAPIPGTKSTEVDRSSLLAWFARDLGGRFGKDLGVTVEDLQHQEPEEQLNYVLQQARRANIMPQEAGLQQIHRLLEVCITNLKAERSYTPQVYPNQVTLFRASEELEDDTHDLSGGWKQLVASEVKTHTLAGNHYSIIREPLVQVLAEHLKASLDKARAVISQS
ncbi:amino acid adenylation domain-containing protein [Scytonema sp. UIC 10036]|uniref:non-ribosomal peptide synthetase n=1 Tax=Scytonema sp. UIC 10036 TaxID=2304196 RepID=UPI0012DAF5F6|nr:non-ribosomal peptide synthetase [Scytonema sp. UIC 10036]MUG96212.1 amino acid adenylation domain-containing protein [Scytonema sp. UIC 10036]